MRMPSGYATANSEKMDKYYIDLLDYRNYIDDSIMKYLIDRYYEIKAMEPEAIYPTQKYADFVRESYYWIFITHQLIYQNKWALNTLKVRASNKTYEVCRFCLEGGIGPHVMAEYKDQFDKDSWPRRYSQWLID